MAGSRDQLRETASSAVVLPCEDLDSTLEFLTGKLGFRVDAVFPADKPSIFEISGHGLRLRLQHAVDGEPAAPHIVLEDASVSTGEVKELEAPNGTLIQLVPPPGPLELPPLQASFSLSRMDGASWNAGRAGMLYRDLIPDRQGGRFIASHIRIADGGPVPDYVHFHEIHFQMIFCYRGWVRVVYEDQGPSFVLHPGDCILQPPRIRHRVLECSPGLEVIEVSCPAEHVTRVDHDLDLPNPAPRRNRRFDGQQFLHHEASGGRWTDWRIGGFKSRDTGIAAATRGMAGARVVRPDEGATRQGASHQAEFLFWFILEGGCDLYRGGAGEERLEAGDAVVVPAGMDHALAEGSHDLELLEVCLPAEPRRPRRPASAGRSPCR